MEEHETDQDRRQAMFDTMSQGDADNLKASATAFANDFILPSAGPSNPRSRNLVDAAETACSVEILPHTGSTAASSGSQGKGKGRATEQSAAPKRAQSAISDFVRPESSRPSKKQKLSYGTLVEDEVKFRKKEALGMVGGGRTLGNSTSKPAFVASARPRSRLLDQPSESQTPSPAVVADQSPWTCLVCTLYVYFHISHKLCHSGSPYADPMNLATWHAQPVLRTEAREVGLGFLYRHCTLDILPLYLFK